MPRLVSMALIVTTASLVVGTGLNNAAERESSEAATPRVDFVQKIEPIFRKNCYSCHGEDAQEGGLRLDQKRRAMEGGDGGKAIAPGDSAGSRLVRMVTGLDDEYGLMPPEGEGTPLKKEEIATIRVWIDGGANWPEDITRANAASHHWSYQPIRRPEIPSVNDNAWIVNTIDAFILARLEQEGIKPSPPADPWMLIRRLYIDLTGLPPSPEQIDQFINDTREDAYERLVERVLASPHYGERWARHWLDLARYADTDGYEKDRPRPFAWRYRQWVIEALNADLPFDQFSIEQIAGDMLPDAEVSKQIASGFHRNTLHNTEGGIDPEEDRVKKTLDRTNTIGTIWLGTTVGCAQCHSHKYDPITQREYYSLYAFLNSMDEKDIAAPLPEELAAYERKKAAFDAKRDELQAAVDAYETKGLAASQARWEETANESGTIWRVLDASSLKSAKGAELTVMPSQSILASGKNLLSDVYTFEAELGETSVTAVRLEVLPHDSLVKRGPGRADNGNFVLTSFRVSRIGLDGQAVDLPLASAQADFSQGGWGVGLAINGDPKDGWAVSPQIGQRHVAAFRLKDPVRVERGQRLRIVLDQTYHQSQPHNIGHFRLSATDVTGPIQLDGLPEDVGAALKVAAADRSESQRKTISAHYRTIDPELTRLRQVVQEYAKGNSPKKPGTKARSVTERSSPREARIHLRGDFLRPGDPVTPGVPEVLPPVAARGERADRLDFARWLFAEQNPLTARVTVNRVWQRYFGHGIVATSDDFGTQGDPPSHPELLDWLAYEFRASGWSLKHLHRLIVTSAVYRQSSAARPDLAQIDPENILLARQSRRRFEAEIIRDVALAVSGLLEPKVGGLSVRPPQPAEYSALTYANSAKWTTSPGGDAYRRGLYTFFQRTSPYPMLMTFDSPDSTLCTAKRSESNTPLQALTLWNDVVFFECAQALGRRIVRESLAGGTPESATAARAGHAFRLCLARNATPKELQTISDLYRSQLDLLEKNPAAAKSIVGDGDRPDAASVTELEAWVMIGRTLMNLDEFVTKE